MRLPCAPTCSSPPLRCRCIYANGDRYEGSWYEDLPEGSGTMLYAGGERYAGAWLRGRSVGKVWGVCGSVKCGECGKQYGEEERCTRGELGVVSCSPSLCNAAAPSTPINTASDAAGVTARAPLFLRTAPGSVEPGRMTAGCRALHTLGEERGGWEGRHTHCPWSASMQSDSAFTKAIPELAPVRPRGGGGQTA